MPVVFRSMRRIQLKEGSMTAGLHQFLKQEDRDDGFFKVLKPDLTESSKEKESLYLVVRAREGRLYTDEQVSQLPDIKANTG